MTRVQEFWDRQHKEQFIKYLSNYSGKGQVWPYLKIDKLIIKDINVLNIGIGTGRCTNELVDKGCKVYVLDISAKAIQNVLKVVEDAYLPNQYDRIPENFFDLAISHLVVQHMADKDLIEQFKHVIWSLKKTGILAVQFASPHPDYNQEFDESEHYQEQGAVIRKISHMKRIVQESGGEVVDIFGETLYDNESGRCAWYGMHIRKKL